MHKKPLLSLLPDIRFIANKFRRNVGRIKRKAGESQQRVEHMSRRDTVLCKKAWQGNIFSDYIFWRKTFAEKHK